MEITERLNEIKEKIKTRKKPQKENVKTIQSWFGVKRRGGNNIPWIERELQRHQLITRPSIQERSWGEVEIHLLQEGEEYDNNYELMIVRLKHLDVACQEPITVTPESLLSEATSKMLVNDFSQLPVMKNSQNVLGFISWKTIGESIALGKDCNYVSQCMEKNIEVIKADTPLTEAIEAVIKHDFIMVEHTNGKTKIRGPVTTTDLSKQYHDIAKPFLLIGQIEASIRKILDAIAPINVLKEAKYKGNEQEHCTPSSLTFEEYKAVFSNEDVWKGLNVNLSKSEILKLLEDLRIMRNEIFHFHPDDEDLSYSIEILKSASSFFEKLAKKAVNKSVINKNIKS